MSRIKLFGGYYLGTGLISGESSACVLSALILSGNSCWHKLFDIVHGECCQFVHHILTSWSLQHLVRQIFDAMYSDGSCSSTTMSDGTVLRNACPDAYGKLLGQSRSGSSFETD